MNGKALEYLLSRPLLCTPEAAEVAASIVSRDGDLEALEAKKGVRMDGETGMYRRSGVAVLPIQGPIFRHANLFTELCGGATTEAIARDLKLAVDDPGVSAILIDADSPGGEAAGIGELAAMIRAADKVKPVCTYVGDQACSAMYWLAAASGEIVVAETAQLGSIGVVMGMKVHADRPGVKSYEFVSSQSPMKRPDPSTEGGKVSLQKRCDDLASVFIRHVAGYRNTTEDIIASDFGKGGVLTGQDAVDAGMADAIGDFEGTLARLARGDKLPVRKPKPKPMPGKTAATDSSKGTLKMAGLYETLFGRVAKSHPDAAAAALTAAEDDGDDDSPPLARRRYQAALLDPDPPADHAKIKAEVRAEIEAELKAKAASDVAVNKTLATFFDKQAMAMAVGSVKAGRLGPPDVPGFKALFTELALADHAGPLAIEGGAVDRVSVLTKLLDGKPAVAWTKEHFQSSESLKDGCEVLPTVYSAGSGEKLKVDQDRVLSMLSATASGREVLAESKTKRA